MCQRDIQTYNNTMAKYEKRPQDKHHFNKNNVENQWPVTKYHQNQRDPGCPGIVNISSSAFATRRITPTKIRSSAISSEKVSHNRESTFIKPKDITKFVNHRSFTFSTRTTNNLYMFLKKWTMSFFNSKSRYNNWYTYDGNLKENWLIFQLRER